MKFVKRLTTPARDNKYYLRPKEGYNKCVQGNTKYGLNYGKYDVLPNCTGWCYGRFLESQKWTSCKLPTSNARSWLIDNKAYDEGYTPRVGSIMVYKNLGKGHVIFVEDIDKNGDILFSESGWNFRLSRMATGKVNAGNYRYGLGYKYLGCIYPDENFEKSYYGTLPTKTLIPGMKDKQVKYLQDFLNWCLGELLTCDGSYGPATKKAVKKFQARYGLVPDGYFGPASLRTAKKVKL